MFLLVLTACRLDVTQTIDVAAKGREVITYRETLDDEAFSVASQLGGPAAFAFDAAKEDGWSVRGSSGPNEHTFIFERSFSGENVAAQLTLLARDSASATAQGGAFPLGPTAFIGLPITPAISETRSASLPALLRPSEAVTNHARKGRAFQLANARVNAAAVDSVVHVHVELRDAAGVHRIDPTFAESTAMSPSAALALHAGRPWPVSPLLAFWRYVGDYGVFDFVHNAAPLCSAEPNQRKSRMFGVGVYASGAEIPRGLTLTAVTLAEAWLARHPVKCP
ncbi:MAG TPA: hypothetical protein VMH02_04330 [Verrucomicrobiae bacterium]|nr:hypothetical protein [Verrucomicrobiae bacterium]